MSGAKAKSRRAKEIEEQLAHVRWLKLQNERKIQESLQSTKLMEQNDKISEISSNHASERSSWVQSVIKSELGKPLVLSDSEIHRMYTEDARTRTMNEDKFLRQDESAKKIMLNLSGKMEFNESTKLSLGRNYESIQGMQKECDERFRKQREYNHSLYLRRERIKVETKKGQSKRLGSHGAMVPDLAGGRDLSPPPSRVQSPA